MEIYIFTRGREADQVTYNQFSEHMQKKIEVVVYADEAYAYNTFPNVYTVPKFPKGIGYKRQYVLERATSPVVFLDDDITFARRRVDDPTKFVACNHLMVHEMITKVQNNLYHYAHGGIAMREGANRYTEEFKDNTRVCRAHYYNAPLLNKLGIKFNRLPLMEDFSVTLQLLTKGYANRTLNGYVQNQGGSGAKGGVSSYRTHSMQAEAAYALQEDFPQFVTAVDKETKEAWGGGTRTDVRIQWKKAFAEGCKLRGTNRGTI